MDKQPRHRPNRMQPLNQTPTKPTYVTPEFLRLTATSFLFQIGYYLTLPIIPVYVKHLGASTTVIGWLGSAFFLSTLIGRPLAAFSVERLGTRPTLLYSALLATAVCVFSPWMLSPTQIAANRCMYGLVYALFTTAVTVLVADNVPSVRTGEALGVFSASVNAAAAFSPALGLLLSDQLGFTPTLVIAAGFPALSTLLIHSESPQTLTTTVESASVATGEILQLIKPLVMPGFVLACFGFTYAIHVSFITVIAAERGILNPEAGLYYASYATAIIAARMTSGRLFDRCGSSWVIIPGNLLAGLALIVLAGTHSLFSFLVVAVIYGIGAGYVHPGVLARMVELVPDHRKATATSLFYASFEVGILAGGPLFGALSAQVGDTTALLAFASLPIASLFLYQLNASQH